MCIYIYIHTHICVFVYIYICIYIYIYISICANKSKTHPEVGDTHAIQSDKHNIPNPTQVHNVTLQGVLTDNTSNNVNDTDHD